MRKTIRRIVLLHRLGVAARSVAAVSVPVVIAGCAVLLLRAARVVDVPAFAAALAAAAAAAVAWVPLFVARRGTALGVARKTDAALGARGVITAGADILRDGGGPRSEWARLVVERAQARLREAGGRAMVPAGSLALFLLLPAALVLLGLSYRFSVDRTRHLAIPLGEEGTLHAFRAPLFNAADEKLLGDLRDDLARALEGLPETYADERLAQVRGEMKKLLAETPRDEEELGEYLRRMDELKKKLGEVAAESQAQKEALKEAGKKMDGSLLGEIGKDLAGEKPGDAASAAGELADALQEKAPSAGKSQEAGGDLKEAALEAAKKAAEKTKGEKAGADGGAAGKKEGQEGGGEEGKAEAGQPGGGAQEGGSMDGKKFDKLKKLVETMNDLAGLFDAKAADKLPDGLKKLAEEFSQLDMDGKQAKELQEMLEKMDGLTNMMVDWKNGPGDKGKGGASLKEKFEKQASGGEGGGDPSGGQKGQGAQGQEKAGSTPSSAGETFEPGSGSKGEGKAGTGKGPQETSAPPQEAGKEDGKSTGKEGWGNGTTPHSSSATHEGGEEAYDDKNVEGKDSSGPSKKDTIKGASKNGFVGKDYKKVYEEYSTIVDEIMDEEKVPSLYRYYVYKYFQLIAPRK